MLALSHVILHVGLCGSIARAPANATIGLRLRLTDRAGRRMLDRVYHFERGDEAESIVEFDSSFGMYRIDLATESTAARPATICSSSPVTIARSPNPSTTLRGRRRERR